MREVIHPILGRPDQGMTIDERPIAVKRLNGAFHKRGEVFTVKRFDRSSGAVREPIPFHDGQRRPGPGTWPSNTRDLISVAQTEARPAGPHICPSPAPAIPAIGCDLARAAGEAMAERTAWRNCRDDGWWSAFGKRKGGGKNAKAGRSTRTWCVGASPRTGRTGCGPRTSPSTRPARASCICAPSRVCTPAAS